MITTARRYPSAAEAGLVLRLAADAISDAGWARPLPGDDEVVVAIDGRLTLVGALHRVTGLPVTAWPHLADERLHPIWDALALALALVDLLGDGVMPRRGLAMIERILRWERSPVSCLGDVLRALRNAAVLAESAAVYVACPACWPDPWRSTDCELCRGEETIHLHPDRWTQTHLRIVTNP